MRQTTSFQLRQSKVLSPLYCNVSVNPAKCASIFADPGDSLIPRPRSQQSCPPREPPRVSADSKIVWTKVASRRSCVRADLDPHLHVTTNLACYSLTSILFFLVRQNLRRAARLIRFTRHDWMWPRLICLPFLLVRPWFTRPCHRCPSRRFKR